MTNAQVGSEALKADFEIGTFYVGLYDVGVSSAGSHEMHEAIEDIEGVQGVLSMDSVLGSTIPMEFLAGTDNASGVSDDAMELLVSDHYKLMLIATEYAVGTDEIHDQMDEILAVMQRYDAAALLTGEAPLRRVRQERLRMYGTAAALFLAAAVAIAVFLIRGRRKRKKQAAGPQAEENR